MEKIFLDTCHSTQETLKEHVECLNSFSPILVSTKKQTNGYGRRGNTWIHTEHSLAMSCTIKLSQEPSLTPLEIACLVTKFFKQFYQVSIFLKWPNDLLNIQGQKLGGIIMHTHRNFALLGIGINLLNNPSQTFPYQTNSIKIKTNTNELAADLYQFILNNRLDQSSIRSDWKNSCIHLNKKVYLNNKIYTFNDINQFGQAVLINQKGEKKEISSGDLSLVLTD